MKSFEKMNKSIPKRRVCSFLIIVSFSKIKMQFCAFICLVALARRQQSDLCGLWVKLPPVTTSLITQK